MIKSADSDRSTRKTGDAAAPLPIRPRYLVALFGGMFGAMAVFCLLLLSMSTTNNLPPPAFSNSLCVDEKLNFLREHPIAQPNLLVIGSSVAWRHVDGEAIARNLPGRQPLNGAFCGLRAHQAVYVANWLLDREPSIRQVVMIVDPQDFTGCWRVRDAAFSRQDVDHYVYEHAASWGYYLHYFAPLSLMRNAMGIKQQRAGLNDMDPLVFTEYGDGPLDPKTDRGLYYGKPEALDGQCFAALNTLAERLQNEGKALLLVSTPLHPQWKKTYDPDGKLLADFDRHLAEALAGTSGLYWNADRLWTPPADAFVDAIHMRWSAAQRFSSALAHELAASSETAGEGKKSPANAYEVALRTPASPTSENHP